jgi:ribosomal protein L6P/L9E
MVFKTFPIVIKKSFFFFILNRKFIRDMFLFKTKILSIILITNGLFIDSFIDLLLMGVLKGYKLYLEMKGSGYKFKLISYNFFFGLSLRLTLSHLMFINLPINFRVFFLNRSLICLYTNNLWDLATIQYAIKFQKKANAYKAKGVL